jgi:hypothetical protein
MLMALTPTQKLQLANWIKNEELAICCLQETHLIESNKHCLMMKGWKMIYQGNDPPQTNNSSNIYIR